MRNKTILALIMPLVFILALVLSAQERVSGRFGWNYEASSADTMAWDGTSAITVKYQLHPKLPDRTWEGHTSATESDWTAPKDTSRFWGALNGASGNWNTLGAVAVANLDSLSRYFRIWNDSGYSWGGYIRFSITDGTTTDTSSACYIGTMKGSLTVFYYFDDDNSDARINEWLFIQGQ